MCLRSLASYCHLDPEDAVFGCETLKEAFQSNMTKGSSTITSQMIGVEFASRYAASETSEAQFLDQLCDILASLEEDIRSYRKERNQHFSFCFFSKVRCIFCNKSTKLLVKCQHKDCTKYCHITCYLRAHKIQCFQYAHSSILFFCEEHEGDVALLNERNKPKDPEKTEEEPTPVAFTPIATGTRLTSRLTALRGVIQNAYKTLLSAGEAVGSANTDEATGLVNTSEAAGPPTKGEIAGSTDSNTLLFPDSLLKDPYFLPMLKQYPEWEGVPQASMDQLRWLTRRITREVRSEAVIVANLVKKRPCSICCGEDSSELFPHYRSRFLVCEECGVLVHSFCARETAKKSHWKCPRCRKRDESVCSICGKATGYQIEAKETFNHLTHVTCLLMTLPSPLTRRESSDPLEPLLRSSDEEESDICDVCKKHGGVLHCSAQNCRRRFHAACEEGMWSLFFQATTEQVSFFVCCPDHQMLIPLIAGNPSAFRPAHSIRFSEAPDWVRGYNRVRCRLSLCNMDILNNSKGYLALRDLFIRCGIQETFHEVQRKRRRVRYDDLAVPSREKKAKRGSSAPTDGTTNRRYLLAVVPT